MNRCPLPTLSCLPSPNQCQRKQPEYRGYAAPSIGVLLGVFLVGGTAFVCGIAAISTAREYAKESAASRENATSARSNRSSRSAIRSRDGEYMMLAGNDSSGLAEGPSAEEGIVEVTKGAARVGGRSRRVRRGRRGLPEADPPGPSPLARMVVRYTQIICGIGMVATLVMCSLVVMFAPHTPGVNMCNTEFDWVRVVRFAGLVLGCYGVDSVLWKDLSNSDKGCICTICDSAFAYCHFIVGGNILLQANK